MGFRLALVQCKHPQGDTVDATVELVEVWSKWAKADGANIVAFPESLMTRYEKGRGQFLAEAQSLGGTYCSVINAMAKKLDLWIVYTVNEFNPAGNPYNTVVVTGNDGRMHGFYRKVHLFDTDFTRESDRMSAGRQLFQPIDTPFCKLGLSICYDLRFPEVARFAAMHGCQLLINPAAWVAGPVKAEQWRTLIAARAIENEMFVAGVSRCDEGYIGNSCICDPFGNTVAQADASEQIVFANIDVAQIDEVRSKIPVFRHRRPECY